MSHSSAYTFRSILDRFIVATGKWWSHMKLAGTAGLSSSRQRKLIAPIRICIMLMGFVYGGVACGNGDKSEHKPGVL